MTTLLNRKAGKLTVIRIDDPADFLPLHAEWNQLAAERSLFLRHEWFDAAWQWRRHEEATQLAILCVYRDARLVGICPLIKRTVRGAGVKRRVLEFLTVPDSQLCDIIASEEERSAVADALASELASRRNDWDVLRLAYLPERAIAGTELMEALGRRGMAQQLTSASGNPYVSLQSNWSSYYATRSRRLKKANNLNANRLNRAGEIRIDWLQAKVAITEEVMAGLETAIAISASSWKSSTGNSLNSPGPQAFIRRLSELAEREGWLSLWLLALNGKQLAMEYQVVFNRAVHALRSDIVDGFEEISPGSHLNRHQLEQLFGRGLDRYFMGPGDNPYKQHWTEGVEPLFQLCAYSPSPRGRLAALWDLKVKPTLRALRKKATQDQKVDKP